MAPPTPEPPSAITLRVKVPPGHIAGGADEFTLGTDLPVSSTIAQIRQQIQNAIPSNPPPERQRLLYGGRALVDNEQTLADALNLKRDPTQTEYVVHLLVKGDGANTAPVPHRRGVSTPGRSASPAQAAQNVTNPQQAQPNQALPPHVGLDQHQQQHDAFLAQQHRLQAQMIHNLNAQHARFAPGHGMPGMLPFGMQNMNFGAGMPMQQPLPNQLFPGMQHQAPQAQNVNGQGQNEASHNAPTDGASESHSAQIGDQAASQPQQRSASQPPPHQPFNNRGMHIQGIGPNGERITVLQQTFRIPDGQQIPQLGAHGLSLPSGGLSALPGMPAQNVPRRNGPTALDQARENITEMRRMLDELRGLDAATDEQRTRIERLEQRTQALNDYIDPFHVGNENNRTQRTNSPFPAQNMQAAQGLRSSSQPPPGQVLPLHQRLPTIAPAVAPITNPSDVTCWLLSSPTGPQAILYSPQHGTFTGGLQASTTATGLHPTPTTHAGPANNGQDQQAAQPAPQAPAQAQAQAPPAQQDGLGPLGPLINHMWLLLRVLIFAYFLLGANLGWRRPLALIAIGVGFWLIRQGLLQDGGALRRWWDGVMNDGQQPRPAQGAGQQQQGQQQGEGQQAQDGNARPAGQMPTPEQVAQRLIDEQRRQGDPRYAWLRERVRPVERAVALLVASLWPGVGEAYVRAREQEERRRAEEEISARRREEEERQRKEEEEKKQAEENGESSEKVASSEGVETSTTSAEPAVPEPQGAAVETAPAPAEQ